MFAHPITGQEFESPVPPGTGWPDDPANANTGIARSADDVRRLADAALPEVEARVSLCRACPRLVKWREDVARDTPLNRVMGQGLQRPGRSEPNERFASLFSAPSTASAPAASQS